MTNKFANIYEYIDYRCFLRDYFDNRRAIEKKFTKTEICRRLGLPNTRSYFTDVLSKKVDLSKPKIELLIAVLELDNQEAQFFRLLVQYNQTMIKSEKDFLFEQLVTLNQTPKKFVEVSEYKFYSNWYHSAVRALLEIIDFKNDYKLLAKKVLSSHHAITSERIHHATQKVKFH